MLIILIKFKSSHVANGYCISAASLPQEIATFTFESTIRWFEDRIGTVAS